MGGSASKRSPICGGVTTASGFIGSFVWMLIVETILKIRRLAHVQGKSIKAMCRELSISRKVVRKVLRNDETEFKYERTRQPQPKFVPWREQLDRIMLANEAKSSREGHVYGDWQMVSILECVGQGRAFNRRNGLPEGARSGRILLRRDHQHSGPQA